METVVSCTLFSMLCSISLHFTPQNAIPRTTHTAVEVRRAICEGPDRASLPKTEIVTESMTTSVMNGMELSHAGGLGMLVLLMLMR